MVTQMMHGEMWAYVLPSMKAIIYKPQTEQSNA